MSAPEEPLAVAVGELRRQLAHLERLAADAMGARRKDPPAARAEPRWPVTAAVAVAVALQVSLPGRELLGPGPLLPALEAVLGLVLLAANPRRVDRRETWLRATSVALVALTSLANAYSDGVLLHALLATHNQLTAAELLGQGGSIYLTNIIVFALWYWEWDAGGPVARLHAERPYPDFLFPQMSVRELSPPGWRPRFPDYMYLSFTNATAFSPTDVMPLAHWSKLLMALQSSIALVTMGLVIARAVNIFP